MLYGSLSGPSEVIKNLIFLVVCDSLSSFLSRRCRTATHHPFFSNSPHSASCLRSMKFGEQTKGCFYLLLHYHPSRYAFRPLPTNAFQSVTYKEPAQFQSSKFYPFKPKSKESEIYRGDTNKHAKHARDYLRNPPKIHSFSGNFKSDSPRPSSPSRPYHSPDFSPPQTPPRPTTRQEPPQAQ